MFHDLHGTHITKKITQQTVQQGNASSQGIIDQRQGKLNGDQGPHMGHGSAAVIPVQENNFIDDEPANIQHRDRNGGAQKAETDIGKGHPGTDRPDQFKKSRQVPKGFQPVFPAGLLLIGKHFLVGVIYKFRSVMPKQFGWYDVFSSYSKQQRMKSLGIILIVIGIAMIIIRGVSVPTQKKVVDIGSLEINKTENKWIGWPTYAGAIVAIKPASASKAARFSFFRISKEALAPALAAMGTPPPSSAQWPPRIRFFTVSYTHLRAHETGRNLVCRL